MRTLALLTLILSFVAVALAQALEAEVRNSLQSMTKLANELYSSAEAMNENSVLGITEGKGPYAEIVSGLEQLSHDAVHLRELLHATAQRFSVAESLRIVKDHRAFTEAQNSFVNAMVNKATILDKLVHIGPSFPPQFTRLRLAIDEMSQALVRYMVPVTEKWINQGKQAMLSGLDIAIKKYTPIVQLTPMSPF